MTKETFFKSHVTDQVTPPKNWRHPLCQGRSDFHVLLINRLDLFLIVAKTNEDLQTQWSYRLYVTGFTHVISPPNSAKFHLIPADTKVSYSAGLQLLLSSTICIFSFLFVVFMFLAFWEFQLPSYCSSIFYSDSFKLL